MQGLIVQEMSLLVDGCNFPLFGVRIYPPHGDRVLHASQSKDYGWASAIPLVHTMLEDNLSDFSWEFEEGEDFLLWFGTEETMATASVCNRVS